MTRHGHPQVSLSQSYTVGGHSVGFDVGGTTGRLDNATPKLFSGYHGGLGREVLALLAGAYQAAGENVAVIISFDHPGGGRDVNITATNVDRDASVPRTDQVTVSASDGTNTLDASSIALGTNNERLGGSNTVCGSGGPTTFADLGADATWAFNQSGITGVTMHVNRGVASAPTASARVDVRLHGIEFSWSDRAIAAPDDLAYTPGLAITPVQLPAVTGGAAHTNYYRLSGNLPAGLSYNATTRTISGTPTTPGTSTLTYTVFDGFGGRNLTPAYTITVNAPPTLRNIGDNIASVGTAVIPFTLSALTGGTAPFRYEAERLPTGLVIDPATGTVTGIPQSSGICSTTIRAIDAGGATATAPAFKWTVWASSSLDWDTLT